MATSSARRASPSTDLPPTVSSTPLDDGPDPFAEGGGIPDLGVVLDERKSSKETEIILASLGQTYLIVSQVVSLFSFQDGVTIARNISELTESWRKLLDDDAKLRKRMLGMAKASGWGAVFAAHAMVALPIIVNHKDDFGHLIKRPTPTE